MSEDLEFKINESRYNMLKKRGKMPTFTDWMLEAAAEKLNREEKDSRFGYK